MLVSDDGHVGLTAAMLVRRQPCCVCVTEAEPTDVCGDYCDGRFELFHFLPVTYQVWISINSLMAFSALCVIPLLLREIHDVICQCEYAWLRYL